MGERPEHPAGDLVSDLTGREAAISFEKVRQDGNPGVERSEIVHRRDDGLDDTGPGKEYPSCFPTRVELLQRLLETGPTLRGRKRDEADALPVEQPRILHEHLPRQGPQPLQQRLVPPLLDEGSAAWDRISCESSFQSPDLAEEHRGILDISGLFEERGGGLADLDASFSLE